MSQPAHRWCGPWRCRLLSLVDSWCTPIEEIALAVKARTVGARGCDDFYAYSVDVVTDSHMSISFPSEFNLSRVNFNASLPSSRCIGGSLDSTTFRIARAALAGATAVTLMPKPRTSCANTSDMPSRANLLPA